MNTLVLNTPEDQFKTIQEGKKAFIVGRFKVPPAIGQRLILQTASEEIDTVITDIHNEPGMMKDYLIVSFPAILQAQQLPPRLQFDFSGPSSSTVLNEMLSESDDIGRLAAH